MVSITTGIMNRRTYIVLRQNRPNTTGTVSRFTSCFLLHMDLIVHHHIHTGNFVPKWKSCRNHEPKLQTLAPYHINFLSNIYHSNWDKFLPFVAIVISTGPLFAAFSDTSGSHVSLRHRWQMRDRRILWWQIINGYGLDFVSRKLQRQLYRTKTDW